jgi:hypothetical protein
VCSLREQSLGRVLQVMPGVRRKLQTNEGQNSNVGYERSSRAGYQSEQRNWKGNGSGGVHSAAKLDGEAFESFSDRLQPFTTRRLFPIPAGNFRYVGKPEERRLVLDLAGYPVYQDLTNVPISRLADSLTHLRPQPKMAAPWPALTRSSAKQSRTTAS